MIKTNIKYLALYLPQFHAIPENDEWWGKNFTEWTNVKAANPYFKGHNQPRIPHKDIGYYNLVNDSEIMAKQAEMAKKYGIYGFAYYLYWFNGKKLLEKPLEQMLNDKKVDIPFCLFWANHNWTRSWDAGNKEILLEQKYNESSYKKFIDDLIPYFNDNRYIRINGKPVLLVYQADHMPDPKKAVSVWRNYAKERYEEELYLITIQQNNMISPDKFGYDAAMEGAPNYRAIHSIVDKVDQPIIPDDVTITFYDYLLNAFQYVLRKEKKYKLYRCVYPDFDNTPRRKKSKGWMFLGSNPERFRNFLIEISKQAVKDFKPDERFVFINAWNEWAECAYLEPDTSKGYALLEICKQVHDMSESSLMSAGFSKQVHAYARKTLRERECSHIYILGKLRVPLFKINKKISIKISFFKHSLIRIK